MNRSEDDLFAQLSGKQAYREYNAVSEDPVTDAKKIKLHMLFESIKNRGSKLEDNDLTAWTRESGMFIPSCLIIFGAFIKGTPLPLIGDPEISSEPLGDLGACLLVGSKLFGFYDASAGIVHLPSGRGLQDDWSDRVNECARFNTFYGQLMVTAHNWEGCHSTLGEEEKGDGQPVIVEFEGEWAGEQPKNMLELFMRKAFAGAKIEYGIQRLEQIEFEREMRKAFGKQ